MSASNDGAKPSVNNTLVTELLPSHWAHTWFQTDKDPANASPPERNCQPGIGALSKHPLNHQTKGRWWPNYDSHWASPRVFNPMMPGLVCVSQRPMKVKRKDWLISNASWIDLGQIWTVQWAFRLPRRDGSEIYNKVQRTRPNNLNLTKLCACFGVHWSFHSQSCPSLKQCKTVIVAVLWEADLSYLRFLDPVGIL